MTEEELKEYNRLPPEGKDAYNSGMRVHPEWTHGQAMTYATIVKIALGGPTELPTGGTTGENELKRIYQTILIKAQQFIQTDFPRIYHQVKETFKKAIEWLSNAVNVTLNKIIDFFK